MVIGCIIVYILFFGMCFMGTGTDKKNIKSYYSYPDRVQQQIQKDERLKEMIPKKSSLTNVFNIVLFSIVFIILGLILHIDGFGLSFIYFLIVGEGLNVFDLAVIDACWWRNTKRIRFSSIPEKELYQDMHKHIGSFIRGIPVFVASALIAALIVSVL